MMGIKKGMLHIYVSDGNIDQVPRQVNTVPAIDSVEVHIGNFDLIGTYDTLIVSNCYKQFRTQKKIEGVDKIVSISVCSAFSYLKRAASS
jgi:hypothetical protein